MTEHSSLDQATSEPPLIICGKEREWRVHGGRRFFQLNLPLARLSLSERYGQWQWSFWFDGVTVGGFEPTLEQAVSELESFAKAKLADVAQVLKWVTES